MEIPVKCTSYSKKRPIIAIFALGTLGDVVPLLIISSHLLGSSSASADISIVFVTNIAHQKVVESYFPLSLDHKKDEDSQTDLDRFSAMYVQTPPVGLSGEDRDSFYNMEELNTICVKVALIKGLSLVVANLFCLAGWLVAECLSLRCILIHPHKPPSKIPSKFLSKLKRCAPLFHRQLMQNHHISDTIKAELRRNSDNLICESDHKDHCFADAGVHVELDLEVEVGVDCVNLQDYEEWLWPTLCEQYDSTRSALNLTHYSSSSYLLPMQPLVLLTVSPRFFPPPGYWPPTRYKIAGYISEIQCNQESSNKGADDKHVLQESLLAFLKNQNCNTICIDFGSMTELIVREYNIGVFCETILLLTDFSFIIMTHGYENILRPRFSSIFSTMSTSSNETINVDIMNKYEERIFFVNRSTSHFLLFKHCVAVLHHGGAGTVGTCLLAGVPQSKDAIFFSMSSFILQTY